MSSSNEKEVKKAREGAKQKRKKGLGELKRTYQEVNHMRKVAKQLRKDLAGERNNPKVRKVVDKKSDKLSEKAKQIEKTMDRLSKVSDLVEVASTGSAQDTGLAVVDMFLEEYATWEGDLFDTGNVVIKIGPFFGFLNVDISFWAGLKAALKARRHNIGIKATATVDGGATLGVGLSVGVALPVIGDLSIGGGIEGGPAMAGKAALTLEVNGRDLDAAMQPATLNIDMVASLYLSMPSVIPEFVIEYVPQLISALKTRGNRILYPLGSINVVVMKTPMYALSFNMRRGQFKNPKKNGEFSAELNPVIKRRVKEMRDAIYQAAEAFSDSLNPMSWVSNPFN